MLGYLRFSCDRGKIPANRGGPIPEVHMEDQPSQKMRIRIGEAEFEADGPTQLIQEQFTRFMDVVERLGAQAIVTPPAPAQPFITGMSPTAVSSAGPMAMPGSGSAVWSPPSAVVEGGASGFTPQPPSLAPAPVGEETMGRVFRRDGDIVTLLALPRTSDVGADTLVVLLYGFLKILGRNAVTGVTLAKAARQSGVDMPRIDNVIAKRKEYVLAAGSRRGRIYSLNNRGVAHAETTVRQILE